MKNQTSPEVEGSCGYQRVCMDCQGIMDWIWGGPITFFRCRKCKRVEPCATIIIEGNTVWKEEGNRKEKVCDFPESERESVLKKVLK